MKNVHTDRDNKTFPYISWLHKTVNPYRNYEKLLHQDKYKVIISLQLCPHMSAFPTFVMYKIEILRYR